MHEKERSRRPDLLAALAILGGFYPREVRADAQRRFLASMEAEFRASRLEVPGWFRDVMADLERDGGMPDA